MMHTVDAPSKMRERYLEGARLGSKIAIADLRTGHQEEARLLLNAILSDRPRDPLARVYLSRLGNGGVRG